MLPYNYVKPMSIHQCNSVSVDVIFNSREFNVCCWKTKAMASNSFCCYPPIFSKFLANVHSSMQFQQIASSIQGTLIFAVSIWERWIITIIFLLLPRHSVFKLATSSYFHAILCLQIGNRSTHLIFGRHITPIQRNVQYTTTRVLWEAPLKKTASIQALPK